MNEIDKMLESLSKADINYRDKLNIIPSEKRTLPYVSVEKAEHYKKPRFRFVPVMALSLMIIAGTGFLLKNSVEVAPPLNSMIDEMTDTKESEETADTEKSEEINADYMNFFGIKNPVESMHFSFFGYINDRRCAYMDNINGNYIISDKNKCSDILQLITDNHIDKKEIYQWDKDFLNYDYINDEKFEPFNAIEFTTEDLQIRMMLGKDVNWLHVKKGDDVSYSRINPDIREPLLKIISECIGSYENSSYNETLDMLDSRKAIFQTHFGHKGKTSDEYEFENDEQCKYVLDIINKNLGEQTDGYDFVWWDGEKHENAHLTVPAFPYMYDTGNVKIENSSRVIPNQLRINFPNCNTELVLIDVNYCDGIMLMQGEQIKYYRLRKCIYFEIYDILSEIEKRNTDLKTKRIEKNLELHVTDGFGNELPIVNRFNAHSDRYEFSYSFSVSLKNTEFEDIPVGSYDVSVGNVFLYDKDGNQIYLTPSSYTCKAQVREEGMLNISVTVYSQLDTDDSLLDFSFYTLTGRFDTIELSDSESRSSTMEYTFPFYTYPIHFDFKYYFEAPAD